METTAAEASRSTVLLYIEFSHFPEHWKKAITGPKKKPVKIIQIPPAIGR